MQTVPNQSAKPGNVIGDGSRPRAIHERLARLLGAHEHNRTNA